MQVRHNEVAHVDTKLRVARRHEPFWHHRNTRGGVAVVASDGEEGRLAAPRPRPDLFHARLRAVDDRHRRVALARQRGVPPGAQPGHARAVERLRDALVRAAHELVCAVALAPRRLVQQQRVVPVAAHVRVSCTWSSSRRMKPFLSCAPGCACGHAPAGCSAARRARLLTSAPPEGLNHGAVAKLMGASLASTFAPNALRPRPPLRRAPES